MSMLVNAVAAKRCCRYCDVDYGKASNGKAKEKFKRTLRRREKQAFKKNPNFGY